MWNLVLPFHPREPVLPLAEQPPADTLPLGPVVPPLGTRPCWAGHLALLSPCTWTPLGLPIRLAGKIAT